MQPYVIKQGDHLALLAYKFGFDAKTVWNDPANADLRKIRADPNILLPTDVLYIPDQGDNNPVSYALTTGQTNTFVTHAPTLTLTHRFVGADASTYASKAYTVQELDQLTGLMTDENGVATFDAPVTLTTATIVFTDTGEAWALAIGVVDPINALSGIFQRLQALGYIGRDAQLDTDTAANNLAILRDGLRSLQADQPNTGATDSTASPDSTPGPSTRASTPGSPSGDDVPSSAGRDDPGSSASGSNPAPPDDAGLGDDGTLSDEMTTMLRQAYGC